MTSSPGSQFDEGSYSPSGDSNKSRRDHLYDDLNEGPEAHHHSIGSGPNEATSLPLARAQFDVRYATIAHTHQELAGDNLIQNGDASEGDAHWSRALVSAAAIIDAGKFITQLNANPSSVIWKSEPFTPSVGEVVTGSITYQGNQTSPILEVSILHNLTGAIPEIGDGISTTDVISTDTIDIVNTSEVRAFSWAVPDCLVARLFIKWSNGGVVSGFPVTITHDNVQLITQLGTISPLYVGVKDPQMMEGTLTITSESPLELPTPNALLGRVLMDQDGSGTVDWADLPPAVKYIQNTPPTDPAIGEQWLDTSKPDVDEFFFTVTHSNVAPYNVSTAPSVVNGTYQDMTDYPTISVEVPCSGLLIVDWQAFLQLSTANSVVGFAVVIASTTSCSASATSTYGTGQARSTDVSSAETNAVGGQAWRITSVGASGGVVELGMKGLLGTGATGGIRFPYVQGRFIPYGELRHTSLVMA